jgi:hypothetical protein
MISMKINYHIEIIELAHGTCYYYNRKVEAG